MFSQRLNELLRNKGITRKQFSEDVQINKNQVKRWEANDAIPNRTTLTVIANYFGVSVAYLKGETDNPTPENKKNSFDKETQSIIFTTQEENIVIAYRNADPVTKRNVNKLLDIEEEQFQPITIKYAARSGNSGEYKASKEEIEKIKNLPDVPDDI